MRQRAALARTLMENKQIILMDEPFSAVDCITRFELQELTANLLKKCTVLLVTHDPMEALRLANEIYILSGSPAQLTLALRLESTAPRNMQDENVFNIKRIYFPY